MDRLNVSGNVFFCYRTSADKSEFDFDIDRYDIQIPSEVYESEKEKYKQPSHSFQSSPESDFSLQVSTSPSYAEKV